MKITILLLIAGTLFCQQVPKKQKQYRSAKSGQYVTKQTAEKHKSTTVSISRRKK
jgi:hypothetical protein